jgi:hypothetical protein
VGSGQQKGEENLKTFVAWVASKTDDDFRALTFRGVLSREELAKECGFSKSALNQNPRIKAGLRKLEVDLRARGILPAVAWQGPIRRQTPLRREPGPVRAAEETGRLYRLEQENAALKAEIAELKRVLEKHTVLRAALSLTGRLPR